MRRVVDTAAALISGLIAVAVLLTLFNSNEGRSADDWDRDVNAAVIQLARDYTLPVTEARPQTVICEHVRPGHSVPECAKYIEAISEHSDSVDSIKDRLNYLAENAPQGVSAEHRHDARQMADALAILTDANHLIVTGWAESDDAKWQQGWSRFEDALTAMGQVYQ